MAWTVEYDEAFAVITVIYRGANTGHDLRDSTTTAIALGKKCGSRLFLIEAADIQLDAAPIELFNLAEKQYPAEDLDHRSRLAVLLPRTAKERELSRFYETVCLNRDWLVRSFEDREEARRWLLEATS